MKRAFRAFCLVVFLTGVLSFSAAWQKGNNDVEPSKPYVMVYVITLTAPDGSKEITSWRTRYVKANGEFKTMMFGPNKEAAFAAAALTDGAAGAPGTSAQVMAGTNEGVYLKAAGSAERKTLGSSSTESAWDTSAPARIHQSYHSHSFLRNNPRFVRMDKCLGLDVYVLRTNADGYWVEESYSPLTGRFPLRTVMHQLDGNQAGYESTIETVQLDFRDVPDDLNNDIVSLPNTGKVGNQSTAKPPKSN
jgi:hypothetical protein